MGLGISWAFPPIPPAVQKAKNASFGLYFPSFNYIFALSEPKQQYVKFHQKFNPFALDAPGRTRYSISFQ